MKILREGEMVINYKRIISHKLRSVDQRTIIINLHCTTMPGVAAVAPASKTKPICQSHRRTLFSSIPHTVLHSLTTAEGIAQVDESFADK
jgi:hypothetical protein